MTAYFKNKDSDFTRLYETYAPKVLRLCTGYCGHPEQAEDLLQETFIAVWQGMDRFRGSAQPGTWIYRIAVNTCLSHLRAPKNKPTHELDEKMFRNRAEDINDQEAQIRQLYKSIQQLPVTERLIISMVLEDIPYPEIAGSMGISEVNLRVKIHRIKQQLSKIYATNEQL